jgi:hypothetical protein
MRKITIAYKIVFEMKSSDLYLHCNILITFSQVVYVAVDWKMVCGYSNNKFFITVQYGGFIDQSTYCQLLKK